MRLNATYSLTQRDAYQSTIKMDVLLLIFIYLFLVLKI